MTGKNSKGRKHTDEFKKNHSIRFSGANNPFFGRQHSIESKNRMSENSKWSDGDFNYCELSERQKEIFDGIMLSDGHLDASNTSARITYGSKFRETLEDIKSELSNLHFSEPWKSKVNCYHFKSSYYKNLLEERHRWYPNGYKIVPHDVRITPLSCQWWFMGDGYQVDYGVMLCTDAFNPESVEILVKKLDFDCHKMNNNRIRINSRSATNFLNWTRDVAPIPQQYLYKWGNHRRQKRSIIHV